MECRNDSTGRGASITDYRKRIATGSPDAKTVTGSRPKTPGTRTRSALTASRPPHPGSASRDSHHTTSRCTGSPSPDTSHSTLEARARS